MATSVTGGVTTTYSLNGLGERVRKINVGLTGGYTEYLYDNAGHLIGEYDGTGATIQETGWLGDMPLTVAAAGTDYFIAPDHLNAPRTIGDGTGAYVWSWARDPFGITQPTTSGGFAGYNLRFPGQYYDSETGLSYNMNRDYNPALGRYVQSDPIGLKGGINTYGYVGGNPLSLTDPFGLDCVDPESMNQDMKITDNKNILVADNSGILDKLLWATPKVANAINQGPSASTMGDPSKVNNQAKSLTDQLNSQNTQATNPGSLQGNGDYYDQKLQQYLRQ